MMNLGPVKRYRAERYVLISLVAFALTVVALRAILWLTGYPQIGEGTVHIAHVLWGGLALFAASLLLLVVSNRWALALGAVLSGAGVGLFIDEVGKFVTRSNNYFTPAAAPIIYGLFLAIVLVYLHVRRPPKRNARGEMYRAFEQMGGVLDREMTRQDLDALTQRLRMVRASSEDEATGTLAASMLAFVEAEKARVAEHSSHRGRRISLLIDAFRRRVLTAGGLRISLVLLLLGCGAYEILSATVPLFLATTPVSGSTGLAARAVLEGGAGLAVIAGGGLIALRGHRRGLGLAVGGLIFGLTVTNLLVLYQDQLRGLIVTVLQCMALTAALSFKRTSLEPQGESAGDDHGADDGHGEVLPKVAA
jgi:hypothetical protein